MGWDLGGVVGVGLGPRGRGEWVGGTRGSGGGGGGT